MRMTYKEKSVNLESAPLSFTLLCDLVKTYFKVSNPVLLIKSDSTLSQVSSSDQLDLINYKSIEEVIVQSPLDAIADAIGVIDLDRLDSLDSCHIQEKSDSDESKRSETACLDKNDSKFLVPESIGSSFYLVNSEMQTVAITQQSQKCGRDRKKTSDFSCQFDSPLVFEVNDLECVIKKEIIFMKNFLKIQMGVVHKNSLCSICHISPIIGIRYECDTCKFSICEKCENERVHEHDLLKHKNSNKGHIEAADQKDSVVKRVMALGLGPLEFIQEIAIKLNYNFDKIVEAVLLQR